MHPDSRHPVSSARSRALVRRVPRNARRDLFGPP